MNDTIREIMESSQRVMRALESPCPAGIRVLVVDDDANDLFMISRALKRVKTPVYEVDSAPDFETGIREILKWRHDLYLVDYKLRAGRTGVDLLEQVREEMGSEPLRAPFLMLTGSGLEEAVDRRAFDTGFAGFLDKNVALTGTNGPLLERAVRYSVRNFKGK